jgi:hypothetical protein
MVPFQKQNGQFFCFFQKKSREVNKEMKYVPLIKNLKFAAGACRVFVDWAHPLTDITFNLQ